MNTNNQTPNNWNQILQKRKEAKTRISGGSIKETTIRIPKEMRELIKQDLRRIEDSEELENMSFNELVLTCLLLQLNMKEYNGKIIRQGNGKSLKNFMDEHRDELGKIIENSENLKSD